MSRTSARFALTIPNGQTSSQRLSDCFINNPKDAAGNTLNIGSVVGGRPARVALAAATSVAIESPAVLTGTVTVYAATYDVGTTFNPVSQWGTDLTIPAGRLVLLPELLGAWDLKLVSGSAEGADRVFVVLIQMDTH